MWYSNLQIFFSVENNQAAEKRLKIVNEEEDQQESDKLSIESLAL